MGGILLICALIAIYLVVYWAIYIEEIGDKTKGFLGFIQDASENLHQFKQVKKTRLKQRFKATSGPVSEQVTDKPLVKNQKSISSKKKFLKRR